MNNKTVLHMDKEYLVFFNELKNQIKRRQIRAALSVNIETIELYWHIGKQIIEKQKIASWGSKLLEQLSHDLQNSFPGARGYSVRNLKYMRSFASFYVMNSIRQQPVAQLPWGHIITLLQRVKENIKREWYIEEIIKNGWSRGTLENNIKLDLYYRQAIPELKTSNYLERLPKPNSNLAHAMLKNPYNFDFLGLHDDALEKEIERAAVKHISKFLMELGKGFAFVGAQVPISLEEDEYFIDMLFYHLKLHSYVVVEWKAGKFKPEHAGKLNFYLNIIDDNYKTSQDNPSIGILLCKSKNKITAEYALKGIDKPIGVSEYQLTRAIPAKFNIELPSIEEIEFELNEGVDDL